MFFEPLLDKRVEEFIMGQAAPAGTHVFYLGATHRFFELMDVTITQLRLYDNSPTELINYGQVLRDIKKEILDDEYDDARAAMAALDDTAEKISKFDPGDVLGKALSRNLLQLHGLIKQNLIDMLKKTSVVSKEPPCKWCGKPLPANYVAQCVHIENHEKWDKIAKKVVTKQPVAIDEMWHLQFRPDLRNVDPKSPAHERARKALEPHVVECGNGRFIGLRKPPTPPPQDMSDAAYAAYLQYEINKLDSDSLPNLSKSSRPTSKKSSRNSSRNSSRRNSHTSSTCGSMSHYDPRDFEHEFDEYGHQLP